MSVARDNGFEFAVQSDPSQAMGDLMYMGLTRYIEALDKTQNLPGVVWLSSERKVLAKGKPDEQIMWLRLGKGDELLPGVDRFDLGIPVVDPNDERPIPVEYQDVERHLFVRKHYIGRAATGEVRTENAIEAAYGYTKLDETLPVRGLISKLASYRLHGIRIWHEKPNPTDSAA